MRTRKQIAAAHRHKMRRLNVCPQCDGGENAHVCETCRGTGFIPKKGKNETS
jgi:DnaJ-class molecular chaperone